MNYIITNFFIVTALLTCSSYGMDRELTTAVISVNCLDKQINKKKEEIEEIDNKINILKKDIKTLYMNKKTENNVTIKETSSSNTLKKQYVMSHEKIKQLKKKFKDNKYLSNDLKSELENIKIPDNDENYSLEIIESLTNINTQLEEIYKKYNQNERANLLQENSQTHNKVSLLVKYLNTKEKKKFDKITSNLKKFDQQNNQLPDTSKNIIELKQDYDSLANLIKNICAQIEVETKKYARECTIITSDYGNSPNYFITNIKKLKAISDLFVELITHKKDYETLVNTFQNNELSDSISTSLTNLEKIIDGILNNYDKKINSSTVGINNLLKDIDSCLLKINKEEDLNEKELQQIIITNIALKKLFNDVLPINGTFEAIKKMPITKNFVEIKTNIEKSLSDISSLFLNQKRLAAYINSKIHLMVTNQKKIILSTENIKKSVENISNLITIAKDQDTTNELINSNRENSRAKIISMAQLIFQMYNNGIILYPLITAVNFYINKATEDDLNDAIHNASSNYLILYQDEKDKNDMDNLADLSKHSGADEKIKKNYASTLNDDLKKRITNLEDQNVYAKKINTLINELIISSWLQDSSKETILVKTLLEKTRTYLTDINNNVQLYKRYLK